ncbi:MAG: GyrI-like domain-containing protein [Anaerolineae bacterium]|nr:GyrI-like domain-containing protein [Anaerolineae bacterium]
MSEGPDFLIGQMRVQTMREQPFFYVVSRPVPMDDLDEELDRLMPQLQAARDEGRIGGPVIIRYYPTDAPRAYLMEVGLPVAVGTPPLGEAQVKTLPAYRCASLLYWGSLEHMGQAYETLMQAIKAAGLEQTGEGREWHYYFEGDASPNNVIGLHMGVL